MKTVRRIVETIERHHPDALVQTRKIAFVSVIGANLKARSLFSKAIQALEEAGVPLVNRTTRRMMLTPEGELYLEHARRILDQIDELSELLGSSKRRPEGLLRVNATLGFGRSPV